MQNAHETRAKTPALLFQTDDARMRLKILSCKTCAHLHQRTKGTGSFFCLFYLYILFIHLFIK